MQKPPKTFADYLVVAISPVLIMLLVGSLAFFLIQVFYRSELIPGVRWVLFWFVLAIVLVSRIGIEQSKQHASGYGIALAIVTWIYLLWSHTAPMFGAILLAITWWCAHKLTVDCTLIDEDEDASGEGVLQGLWKELEKSLEPPPTLDPRPSTLARPRPTLPQLPASVALPKRRKPARQPGRWVVYFSLAALPLFGLGQLLLPDDPAARRAGFEFLAVYLAAALSLLITTSFLGMRRYLRQRFVEMSSGIAVSWVRFGVILAVIVLFLALVLPRPGATNTWHNLAYQVSPKQHPASDHALPFNPAGEGQGTPASHPNENPGAATPTEKPGAGSGTPGGAGVSPAAGDSGQSGGAGQGQSSGSGGGGGGGGGSGGGSHRPPKPDESPNGAESDSGNKPVHANDDGKEPQDGNGNGHGSGEAGQPGDGQKPPQPKPNPAPTQQQPTQEPQPEQKPKTPEPKHIDWQRLLRILLLIALAALFVWFVVRYRRAIAQAFRSFFAAVRAFFLSLFSFRRSPEPAMISNVTSPAPPPQPFASFENPFLTGKDKSWPPERLIFYTHEAIRAWAAEHRLESRPEETPREFLLRLAGRLPDFGPDLERFSYLYGYAAFADELPEDYDSESIHFLWTYMGDSVLAISSR